MNTMHFLSMVGAISLTLLLRPVREHILDWLEEKEDSFWDKMPWRKNKKPKSNSMYHNTIGKYGPARYGPVQYYPPKHLVSETKVYSKDELLSLNGDETFYLDKAIAKNAKLSRYNISYSSDPQGYLYYENCFTIIRGENRITTTIWMHIEGEHPSEQDEDFAREMRYILNFLPFMADV